MDGIRKYSKEWFTLKGTDEINTKMQALKDGVGKDNSYQGGSISGTIFMGTLDDAKANFDNHVSNMHGAPTSTYLNIRNYGLDNIFNALDANSDGTVTEEELMDVAAVSTSETATKDDTYFSTQDLELLYENAMAAIDSSFVEDGDLTTLTYSDGSKTVLRTDENDKIIAKTDITQNSDGSRTEKLNNYEQNSIITSEYDNIGRLTSKKEDYEGELNDKTTTIQYGNIKRGESSVLASGSSAASADTQNSVVVNGTKYSISSQGSTSGAIKTEETIGTKTVSIVDNKGNNIDSELSVKYDSDKQIGDTEQESIGDCWLLAGVNALSYSTKGQEIIKESIKHNDDGSVTVNLAGVGKSYTYSAEEIVAHEYTDKSLSFSTGDIDMNILEMAISEYRKENFDNNQSSFFGLDRAHNKGCATTNDPASGGMLDEAVYLLTGTDAKLYFNPRIVDTGKYADKMLDNFQSKPDDYAVVCTFKGENRSLGDVVTDHVYSIKSVDDDNVYVVNPWDSSKVITYPREDFIDNLDSLSSTDLVEATTAKKLDSQKWDNKLVSAISENILGPADTLLRPTVEDAIEKGKEYVDDVKELVTEIKNGDIDWGAVADEAVDDVKDWFKSKFSW